MSSTHNAVDNAILTMFREELTEEFLRQTFAVTKKRTTIQSNPQAVFKPVYHLNTPTDK